MRICLNCGCMFVTNSQAQTCSDECRRERQRQADKRYSTSEHGRKKRNANKKKWLNTERGRKVKLQSAIRYRNSDHGKEARKQFQLKYRDSGRARQWRRRYRAEGAAAYDVLRDLGVLPLALGQKELDMFRRDARNVFKEIGLF